MIQRFLVIGICFFANFFIIVEASELSPAIAVAIADARETHEEKLSVLKDGTKRSHAWGDLGMLYHANHLRLLALNAYGSALEEQPILKWYYLRGVVRAEMGDVQGSLEDFQSFVNGNPRHSVGWYRIGTAALLSGDTKAAQTAFEKALELGENSAIVMAGLADVAITLGDNRRAIDWLMQAYRIEPQSGQLAYKLAVAFQKSGNTVLAQEWLDKVGEERIAPPIEDQLLLEVAQLSRSARFFEVAADWSLARGDRDEAIAALFSAVEIEPTDTTLAIRLIQMLDSDGRGGEALDLVQRLKDKSLMSDRRLDYAHAWLLRQSRRQEQIVLAAKLADRVAKDWNAEKPMSLAGSLSMRANAYHRANYYFQILARDYPSAYYNYWLGMSASAIGNCKGLFGFEEAVRLEPKWAEAHIAFTRSLAVCGKSVLSKERAQLLIAIHDNVDTRMTLAFAEFAIGDLERARDIASEYLPHPDAQNLIGHLRGDDEKSSLKIFAVNSKKWDPIAMGITTNDPGPQPGL